MAILPRPVLDYTNKDFDSMNARLNSLIDQAHPSWTDRNTGNFGNTFREMFAYVLDTPLFYMDNQAKEAFWFSVTQRKNAIALGKQIRFFPFGAQAAEVDVTFRLGAIPVNDVVIPAGTLVRTAAITDAVTFRLLSDVTIPAGANPPEAVGTVRNSEERIAQFEADGLPSQEVVLEATPFLERGLSVQATNGTFSDVRDFLGSRATDRHYVVSVDQNDRATLRFGSGENGELPVGTIIVNYEIGGGPDGQVEEGSISRIDGTFSDALGNPVTITVNNANASQGGLARQSLASIKEQGPLSLRVLARTVTQDDFEIAAITKIPSVVRALALSSDQDLSIPENQTFLFPLADSGEANFHAPTQVSQADKEAIAAIYTTRFEDGGLPKTITHRVTVFDTPFREIDIFGVLFFIQGVSPVATAQQVLSNLRRFFAVVDAEGAINTNVEFGFRNKQADGTPSGSIAYSDIFNVVRDTVGVRKIGAGLTEFTLNNLHQDVPIQLRQFPTLGSLKLLNGDTNETVIDV